jgi:hypothetical protein
MESQYSKPSAPVIEAAFWALETSKASFGVVWCAATLDYVDVLPNAENVDSDSTKASYSGQVVSTASGGGRCGVLIRRRTIAAMTHLYSFSPAVIVIALRPHVH